MMKLEIYPVHWNHPILTAFETIRLSPPLTCSIQIPSFFPKRKSQSNLLVPYFNTESRQINLVAELSISSCSLSLSSL